MENPRKRRRLASSDDSDSESGSGTDSGSESDSDSDFVFDPSLSDLEPDVRLARFNAASAYKLANQPERYSLESDSSLKVGGNTSTNPFKLTQYISELEKLYKEDVDPEDVNEIKDDVRLSDNAARVTTHYWMMSSTTIDEEMVDDSQANAKATQAMKDAIGKDIVGYLKAAVKDDDTREAFQGWWKASSANQQWLENAFRQADAGKHEWIPSDMMPDVLDFASEEGVEWVTLQHELRSNTKDIIFKPSKAEYDTKVSADKKVLQGHSGALYVKKIGVDAFKPATKGQPAFHNALRDSFNAKKDDGVKETTKALKGVFEAWVWKNEDPGDVHDTYYRKPNGGPSSSAAALKGTQGASYDRILKKFTDLLK